MIPAELIPYLIDAGVYTCAAGAGLCLYLWSQ